MAGGKKNKIVINKADFKKNPALVVCSSRPCQLLHYFSLLTTTTKSQLPLISLNIQIHYRDKPAWRENSSILHWKGAQPL